MKVSADTSRDTRDTAAISRRRLALASAAQLLGRILSAALGVVLAAVLARALHTAQYGEFSLTLTVASLATSVGDLGMATVATREMARHPPDRPEIVGALLVARLCLSIVLFVVGSLICLLLIHGHGSSAMTIFVMASVPVGALGVLATAAQARLRPELMIVALLVQSVTWLAAVVVLSARHSGVGAYGLAFLGSNALQVTITVAIMTGITKVRFAGTRALIRRLVRASWPLALAGVFVTAYYRLDAVLLYAYRGATANAYYSAAYRFLDVLQLLPTTISSVLLPLLARVDDRDPSSTTSKRLYELAITVSVALALPIAIGGAILSTPIVDLIYGHRYLASAPLLAVLIGAFVWICPGYVVTNVLTLRHAMRAYVGLSALGALANVGANLILIPKFGAAAAAWTTLGTECLVISSLAIYASARLGFPIPLARLARLVPSAAVLALATWILRHSPVGVPIAVAVILYPTVLITTRGFQVSEVRALLSAKEAARA